LNHLDLTNKASFQRINILVGLSQSVDFAQTHGSDMKASEGNVSEQADLS
jgi:hypothetical protein